MIYRVRCVGNVFYSMKLNIFMKLEKIFDAFTNEFLHYSIYFQTASIYSCTVTPKIDIRMDRPKPPFPYSIF